MTEFTRRVIALRPRPIAAGVAQTAAAGNYTIPLSVVDDSNPTQIVDVSLPIVIL